MTPFSVSRGSPVLVYTLQWTYVNNSYIRSGLRCSLLHHRQKRLCEQEWTDVTVSRVSLHIRPRWEVPAYFMTILSEMLSDVLP